MGDRPRPVGLPRGRGVADGRRHASVLIALGAAIVAGGLAIAWVPFRTGHSNLQVALALIVVMTAAGATRRRGAVAAAVAVGSLGFTFFDTEPYERFAISRQPDIVTAISLVVVGLITGELALRVAWDRVAEHAAAGHLSRVRQAAARLADGEELVVLIGAVASELTTLLRLEDCTFAADPIPAGTPRVVREGHLEPPLAPDDREITLPVWALGQIVGSFVLVPRRRADLTAERLLVAVTLADQAGAALAVQAAPAPLPEDPHAPVSPRLRVLRQPL